MQLIAGQSQPMEKYSKLHQIQTRAIFSKKKATKTLQFILGTMPYYERSVDPTILWAINEILRVQSKPTQDTVEKVKVHLDYAATYPNLIPR